jgi:hypothetical protein
VPGYLSVDWILGLFSTERRTAQRRYQAFVEGGMQAASPWDKLQGQVLLGEEGFVERFKGLLTDREQVKEIPRPQRYVGRPSLTKLFKGIDTKAGRDRGTHDAHVKYGYRLKEIADHLKIHYTTVSKVVSKRDWGKN